MHSMFCGDGWNEWWADNENPFEVVGTGWSRQGHEMEWIK